MNELREKIAKFLEDWWYNDQTSFEAADAILALPEIQDLIRDAERYRYIRDQVDGDLAEDNLFRMLQSVWGDELDAAIDAAREE